MKIKLPLILCLALLVDGQDMSFSKRNSPLLESFGCMERTDVIVFMPIVYITEHSLLNEFNGKLEKLTDSPCHSISFYSQSRKIVPWSPTNAEVDRFLMRKISDLEFFDLLDFLYHNDNDSMNSTGNQNILLIYQVHDIMSDTVWNRIDGWLKKATTWSIVVICTPDLCPTSIFPIIQVQRIVPVSHSTQNFNRLSDVIRNPDFDPFEFQRFVLKQDYNPKFLWLANKTIHVFIAYLSVELLENTVHIIENTQGLNTNITLYISNQFNIKSKMQFWRFYIEKRGWTNIVNVRYQLQTDIDLLQSPGNTTQLFLLYKENSGFYRSEKFCQTVSKSIASLPKGNTDDDGGYILRSWYDNLSPDCKNFYTKMPSTNDILTRKHFDDHFIKEILKASRF